MARASGSTRAQRDERRADVERRLVAALQRLIEEEPRFTELNLARLLEETGVSRTSFYKYFESKTDVLASWFDDVVAQLLGAVEEIDPIPPTRDQLSAACDAVAAVYCAQLPLINAVYETAAHDYDMRERLATALSDYEAQVRRHLTRGKREGWVNQALDPAAVAAWLIGLAENGLRYIAGEGDGPGATVTPLADIIWLSVYAPA